MAQSGEREKRFREFHRSSTNRRWLTLFSDESLFFVRENYSSASPNFEPRVMMCVIYGEVIIHIQRDRTQASRIGACLGATGAVHAPQRSLFKKADLASESFVSKRASLAFRCYEWNLCSALPVANATASLEGQKVNHNSWTYLIKN